MASRIREFPRFKLFPPISREPGMPLEFPARGFLLNITELGPPPSRAGPWHCARCHRLLAEAGVRDITLYEPLLEYVATGRPLSKAAYPQVLRAAA